MRSLANINSSLMALGVPDDLAEYLSTGLVYNDEVSQFDLAQILVHQIPSGATEMHLGSDDLEVVFLCSLGEALRINSAGDIQHSQTDLFISGISTDDNQAVVLCGGHTYGLGYGASIIVGGRYHGHPGQIVIMGGAGGVENCVMIATGDGSYINPSNGHIDGVTRLTFRANGDFAYRGDPQYFYSEGGDTPNKKSFWLCGGNSGAESDGAVMFVSGVAEETLLGRCGFYGAAVATGHIENHLNHVSASWKLFDSGGGSTLEINDAGKFSYNKTNTPAGTTGAQTINRPTGTVNFAAGASSLVVTNSLCSVDSIVLCSIRTNDATATIKNIVPGSGSFTIRLTAAATAEVSVGFLILN